MAMAYKQKPRNYKPTNPPKDDACLTTLCPPTPTSSTFHSETEVQQNERSKIRFVRVEDRLFKVPEGFFMQMPCEVRDEIKFTSGLGSTPEKPIVLIGHTSDQFKQILSAYNAYPSLDVDALTLDHFLTIGELSLRYRMHDLHEWFVPALRSIVLPRGSPLRMAQECMYPRIFKLAMRLRMPEICESMEKKWASRLHWGEFSPVWAIRFACQYRLRYLFSHACYAYLMSVHGKIAGGAGSVCELVGPLSVEQCTHIVSGYLSLRTTWNHLRQNPPEFEAAPGCPLHPTCIRVWKQRWTAVFDDPCELPEVDVLNRLVCIQESLEEDKCLTIGLSSQCRELALKAIDSKRDQVFHQLHHHFDL